MAKIKSKLAEIKTKATKDSVEKYLNSIKDAQKREDSFAILEMMKKATGEKPTLWGSSLIGFGHVTVKSPATGREVEWFKVGFAPRKTNLSLYLSGSLKRYAAEMNKLGKHKTGVGCLYINKLADVDVKLLQKMITTAAKIGYQF